MQPRPFTAKQAFASLLIETWKKPVLSFETIGATSPATPECNEAMALNAYSILHDRRIPQMTAQMLEDYYQTVRPVDGMNPKAVLKGFTAPPAQSPVNENNHLFGFRGKPLPKIDLFSGVRISGWLLKAMLGCRDSKGTGGTKYKSLNLEEMIGTLAVNREKSWAWLTDRAGAISKMDPSTVADFVSMFPLFLELLNEVRCDPSFGMNLTQWSAGANELDAHRKCQGHGSHPELAESWIAPLGVSYVPGEVFLIFKFPARMAGFLCRPSHLDAGFYREHFPSPLDDASSWPAHPMYLADSNTCPNVPLITEFVHPAVKFDTSHLHAIALTQSSSHLDKIPQQRKLHWPRLDQNYPSCNLAQRLFPSHTGINRCNFAACGCPTGCCKDIV